MNSTIHRIGVAVIAAACALSGVAQAEQITLISSTSRWAAGTGFGDWAGAAITTYAMDGSTPGMLTSVRPNGQGSWDRDYSSNNQIEWGPGWRNDSAIGFPVPSSLRPTLAQVESWSESNFKGSWSIGWGSDSFTYDTTPRWVSAAGRTYATLSAASIAALDAARSGGGSGSLTLSMAHSLQYYGATRASLILRSYSGTQYAQAEYLTSGTDFTFTNLPPIPSDTLAILRLETIGGWDTAGSHQVSTVLNAETFYAPVPAPGALALLGVAGLGAASRRRRR